MMKIKIRGRILILPLDTYTDSIYLKLQVYLKDTSSKILHII
jgi:hypothetical protein